MIDKTIVVLIVVTLANCQEKKIWPSYPPSIYSGNLKERLKTPPTPMPNFNVMRWTGPWFYQYHKAPCSWPISEDFTDYRQVLELHGKNVMHYETMRYRNICNSVTSVLTMTDRPGVFKGQDPIGDNWSGNCFVIATDYKSFSITWGCTKWSTFGKRCEDTTIYVKTRHPKPGNVVLRRIEATLKNILGVSLNQLTRVNHGKPCPSGGKAKG